jgi:hypothetical protein
MSGDINFFLETDWVNTFTDESSIKLILEKIAVVKETLKVLNKDDLEKTILYVQNLTKLCKLYYMPK